MQPILVYSYVDAASVRKYRPIATLIVRRYNMGSDLPLYVIQITS